MKKATLLFTALILSFVLIAQPPKGPAESGMSFGAKITAKGAVKADELPALLAGVDEKEVKVSGKVVEVCKAEGCWIKMETANGPMMIKMKDHSFFVPVSLNGKNIVVDGIVTRKETSVEMLRHYAEDAGKSKAEISAITTAKTEISMQAMGILVQ